ncbi:hypothetical protein D3C85_1071980 [compost metagenome]
MQLAIEGGALGLHIGDVEDLLVSAAGELDAQRLAHGRAGTVAASNVPGITSFLMAGRGEQARRDMLAIVEKAQQFGVALDRHIEFHQPLDQQQLVLVLREDFQEWIGRQALADSVQRQARDLLALDPEVGGRHQVALLHDGVGQVQLAVQLQGAGLHGQCAGSGAGFEGLVDDAHGNAQFAEPECQYQPGRAGADDQYVAMLHDGFPLFD